MASRLGRFGPWRCFDTVLLLLGILMTIVAVVCFFTVFPRTRPDPERHGGKHPDYEETECRLGGDPDDSGSHGYDDDEIECTRNDRNEWCDGKYWWGKRGHRHKRSWGNPGGRHRRFPCVRVRVSFIFRGRKLAGILYESWMEAENFHRCSTSSCLEDRSENEKKVRKWRDGLDDRFPCYVNKHKTDDVVLKRNDIYCLAQKPGFHAFLWPALIAGICFFWLLVRRCCFCCWASTTRADPKVKPDVEGIYVPDQEGPLPEKKGIEGGEVILAPPIVGPPPTYDGHYKDVDTVSMMSSPPSYDGSTTPAEAAVPRVDA